MQSNNLIFHVRRENEIHPTFVVSAVGEGRDFYMYCDCLASKHGALICPHIVAVLRENHDLVLYGSSQFNELKERSVGSQTVDPDNGYWKFYPPD